MARAKKTNAKTTPKAKAKAKTKTKTAAKPQPRAAAKARRGFGTIDYGDGVHGLTLVGPGYAWESIGLHVAAKLSLAERLTFDCEGSMFVARSTDPSVLAVLQAALDPILDDRAEFKRLVAELGEQ